MPINDKNIYNKNIQKFQEDWNKLMREGIELLEKMSKFGTKITGAKNIKELNTATSKLNETQKRYKKTVEGAIKIENELTKSTKKQKDADLLLAKAKIKKREETKKTNEQAKKELGLTQKQTSFTKKLTSAYQASIIKMVAIVAAFRGVIRIIKTSLDNYDKQVKAEKSLQVALGKTSKELLSQASALQKRTRFGDESIIAGQAFLAQMGLEEQQIKRLTPAILDMAEAKGMDLKTAFDLVSKTVGSSTNALSRYGLTIEGVAKSDARVESAVKALSGAFEGQAEAALVGTGIITQFSNIVGDLKERLGGLLIKGLYPIFKGLNNLLAPTEKLSEEFENQKYEVNHLVDSIVSLDENNDIRKGLIDDLNKVYPDLLKNIDAETISNKELLDLVESYNLAIDEKIKRVVWEEELLAIEEKKKAAYIEEKQLIKDISIFYNTWVKNRQDGLSVEEKLNAIKTEELSLAAKTSSAQAIILNQAITEKTLRESAITSENSLNKIRGKRNELALEYLGVLEERGETEQLEEYVKAGQEKILFDVDSYLKEKKLDELRGLSKKELADLQKEITDQIIDDELALLNVKIETDNAEIDSEIKKNQKLAIERQNEFENYKEHIKNRILLTTSYAQEVGGILAKSIGQGEEALKAAAKKILLLTLKTIKSEIQQAIIAAKIKAVVASLISGESISTGGILGIIKGGIIVGLIEAAYKGVEAKLEKSIPSFFKGGEHEGGLAKLHGQELVKTKDGSYFTDWNKYESKIIPLPEAQITSNQELIKYDINNIAKLGNDIALQGGISKNEYERITNNQTEKIVNGLKNMPQHTFRGATLESTKKGNSWIIYKDSKY